MQPLDKKSLFSIFESGDEEIYKENGIEEVLKNPYVLMGMVMQGLQSFVLMDLMYKRNFPEEYKKAAKGVKYSFYNKLYGYLVDIEDGQDNTVYSIGESYDKDEVQLALDTLRLYFEGIEEYEKCAVIKKYIDLLNRKVVKV